MFDYVWGGIAFVVCGLWFALIFMWIGVAIGRGLDKREFCGHIHGGVHHGRDCKSDIGVAGDQKRVEEINTLADRLNVKIGGVD